MIANRNICHVKARLDVLLLQDLHDVCCHLLKIWINSNGTVAAISMGGSMATGYPLVNVYIANWKITIEIVDFSIKHGELGKKSLFQWDFGRLNPLK